MVAFCDVLPMDIMGVINSFVMNWEGDTILVDTEYLVRYVKIIVTNTRDNLTPMVQREDRM